MSGRVAPWKISGTYLEACNCEAICPCRRIGGRQGGRSTSGTCMGMLSWSIESGGTEEADLSGLNAVMVLTYDDDEAGSPWDHYLYVDERGTEAQQAALENILLGRLGGTPDEQFPWVFKPSRLLGVREIHIEVDHSPRRGWVRAGAQASVTVGDPISDQEPVTCVIPGHDREGHELIAESLEVDDDPLGFAFKGKCAFWSTFEYSAA
jgi:hypothetical protein